MEPVGNMKLSVIIPAYNEASVMEATLRNLSEQAPDEIIVVDGGSKDQTADVARPFAKVLVSGKGRAVQMNRGASEASGDILVFLHADTLLPKDGLQKIKQLIESGQVEAGRFRLSFDANDWTLKLFASYTRFHCFSYGDQAFFMKRGLFEAMGGYDASVPFEDMEFYKRLRQRTQPFIIKDKVVTSARRFLKVGKMRQKWINLFLVGLYYFGVDVMPLKERNYQDVR